MFAMHTQVGIVSTRKGARVHVAINGRAYCGAGNGRIIGHSRNINAHDHGKLCRRCARAYEPRLILDMDAKNRRPDAESRRFASRLEAMLDEVCPLTPADLATLDEMASGIAAAYA
jgi:hypothetical protein